MPRNLTPEASAAPTREAKLKAEKAELQRQLTEALSARVLDEDYEAFITRALAARVKPPDWTRATRRAKSHLVLPVTNFSDWHLDEVVDPAQVQNRNGYSRAIAERRLRYYFDNVCKVARHYVHGFVYPGIVVNFLGDNFSGFIHDELRRTNDATLLESLLHWLGPVQSGLTQLATEFGHVWVTGVVGNHGRYDKKPIAKMRAHENFDWLFMQLLANQFRQANDKRVEFTIAHGAKLQFSLFDLRVITSHGDECKGGSGIAGMLSPQLIAFSRMKKSYEFDQWFLGHWHQLGAYRGIRVNGSGKGYDEYAAINNFDFQEPLQDFFLVAPRAGVIASWPIHCQLPDEPWARPGRAAPAFSA